MIKKNIVLLVICAIISLLLTCIFDFSNSAIICYEFIINMEITLFSVSLAIVALMITILEKYKDKLSNQPNWIRDSTDILTEISENTIALLFLVIILIIASVLNSVIILIPNFDIMTTILVFSLLVSLLSIFDTTIGIHKLVSNLKNVLYANDEELNLSQKEIHLIEAYRFLDDEHKKTFDDLVKAIATNQQLASQSKHDTN